MNYVKTCLQRKLYIFTSFKYKPKAFLYTVKSQVLSFM